MARLKSPPGCLTRRAYYMKEQTKTTSESPPSDACITTSLQLIEVSAVSHNLTITTLLCLILGVDLNTMRRIRQHNATINLIEYNPVRDWAIVTMNALAHLSGGLTSDEKPYL